MFRTLLLSVLVLSAPASADPAEETCDPDKILARMKACPAGPSDSDPGLCDPDKIIKSCPLASFAVMESPNGTGITLSTHEAFSLYNDCRAGKAGLSCTAWPQEHEQGANLRYEWTFETRHAKVTLADATTPWSHFACKPGEYVVATLVVANGSYRATSKQGLRCSP
jgi:hypothetical protein